MPRTFASIALFLFLVASPLSAQTVDSVAGKKVVVLGDSITQAGEYVTFFDYYLQKLNPKKDFDIYGLGLASETVSGLSEPNHAGGAFARPCLFERLGRVLEKAKPDVVIACYGMNDGIYLPLDPDRFDAFKKGINKLIEQCKAGGVKEIFIVTPPIYDLSPKGGEFNYDAVLTAYAAWEMTLSIPDVHVIDLHSAMRKARDARTKIFSGDHVHPGEEGHLLMARTILGALDVSIPDESLDTIKADPMFKLVNEKRQMRWEHWMQHIGYTREKVVAPKPLENTETDAAKLQEKIDALRRQK